jgi:cytochrome c553
MPQQCLMSAARGLTGPACRSRAKAGKRPSAWLLVVAVSLAWFAAPVAADPAEVAKTKGCATCHGMDGQGTSPMFPNLAGQSEVYLEQQLKAFRSGRRQAAQMSIAVQNLSDQDIRDLAAYYAGLRPCGS